VLARFLLIYFLLLQVCENFFEVVTGAGYTMRKSARQSLKSGDYTGLAKKIPNPRSIETHHERSYHCDTWLRTFAEFEGRPCPSSRRGGTKDKENPILDMSTTKHIQICHGADVE
jgi:hypothetical protein